MSESKHTPGPWECRMYAGGCVIVSKHDAPGSSVRARLKGVTVKVDAVIYDDQSNAHEASPDARLIAAAPDLLEALVALTDVAIHATSEDGDVSDIDGSLIDSARAAIEKATGGPK